ncbi:MAG: ABC transporter substrate-binding protein [Actinomycetota bacterium]
MRSTRILSRGSFARLVAVLAAVALLAAACGDDADDDASASSSASASASASASEPASGSGSGSSSASEPAEESDEDAATDDGAAAGTVAVADVLGETEVTITDSGVYALDEFAGIALLTLGVEPVAVENFFFDATLGAVVEAEGIALNEAGSLETVAAAQPELILGIGHPNHIEVREQHLAIAQTVTPDFTTSWVDQTAVFAAATGTDARGEAVAAAVQARIDELAAEIEGAGRSGEQVSIIQTFGAEYYAYGPTTLVGQIVEEVGLTRSELQSGAGDFGFILLSEEQLGQETSSEVVIGISGVDSDFVSIFDSPVVEADEADTGIVIDTWTGNHALAAWIILDDLQSILFGDGSTTTLESVPEAWSELESAIDAQG